MDENKVVYIKEWWCDGDKIYADSIIEAVTMRVNMYGEAPSSVRPWTEQDEVENQKTLRAERRWKEVDPTQAARHGYGILSPTGVLIAWAIDARVAKRIATQYETIHNVQNGRVLPQS